jgi:TetR/AcrR family transcriptional regulator
MLASPPSASARRPGRSGSVDATSRGKILDVAEALFAQRGFAGVGLREVAQQVGLGKSSLFHHFPTKLALYDEVLVRVLERVEARLAPALAGAETGPVERLDRWVDAIIDALAEHPTSARLALRSLFEEDNAQHVADAGRPDWEETLARLVGDFQRLLADGIEAGAFRRVSIGHLTQTVIGATVYHFASSTFGEEVVGASLFSAAQVARRKEEVKNLLRSGVLQPGPAIA